MTGSAQIKIFYLILWYATPSLLNNLGEHLQKKNSLTKIYLHACKLPTLQQITLHKETTNLKEFAEGLAHQTSLKTLSLSHIRLSGTGIEDIALSLTHVTTLKTLEFNRCDLTDEALQVCSILLNNPNLTQFSLSANHLS